MSENAIGRITIGGRTAEVVTTVGETLLSALAGAGLFVSAPCGGNGTCGHCRVIASGALSPMTEEERALLGDAVQSGVRLACRCRVCGDFSATLWEDTIRVEKTRVASASPSAERAGRYGLAVDVGTTTVAVCLCDGTAAIDVCGFRNPQSVFGADVIARVDKIMRDRAMLEKERRVLIAEIDRAARSLMQKHAVAPEAIRQVVLCGNTVMEHIAAGVDPSPIAVAPFRVPSRFGKAFSADAVGLSDLPNAEVYFAPCIASYVGGDITCGILVGGIPDGKTTLFLDVGTNGEIVLSAGGTLYACSAAAGPAFEGAQITCGMASERGAICGVSVRDGKLIFETIDGAPVRGICGSGILDLVACLLDLGALDETGRLITGDGSPVVKENNRTWIPLNEDGTLSFTGADVREVQLAKAAIAAGIRTLLHEANLSPEDVGRVVLAGGFGSHLRAASACRIGLIPASLCDKIESAGNTALAGAVGLLLGQNAKSDAADIAANTRYIELSSHAFFMEAYPEEMEFI